jgi:hypothetical protein
MPERFDSQEEWEQNNPFGAWLLRWIPDAMTVREALPYALCFVAFLVPIIILAATL